MLIKMILDFTKTIENDPQIFITLKIIHRQGLIKKYNIISNFIVD